MEILLGLIILYFIWYMFNSKHIQTTPITDQSIKKESSVKKLIIKPDGKIINVEIPVSIPTETKHDNVLTSETPEILTPVGEIKLNRTGIWAEKDQYGYIYYPEEFDTPNGKRIRYIMRGTYCNKNKDNVECHKFKNSFCSDLFNARNMGLCINGNYTETYA